MLTKLSHLRCNLSSIYSTVPFEKVSSGLNFSIRIGERSYQPFSAGQKWSVLFSFFLQTKVPEMIGSSAAKASNIFLAREDDAGKARAKHWALVLNNPVELVHYTKSEASLSFILRSLCIQGVT